MFRSRNEAENLLPSITKNCGTPIKQTHTKPQKTLEFRRTQPRETFSFKPSIILGHGCKWMMGLTSSEVYRSIFNITEQNNKVDFYLFPPIKNWTNFV